MNKFSGVLTLTFFSCMMIFSSCEEAYQEAKDERRLGEGYPGQATESPVQSTSAKPDPSPIPVFSSEALNMAVDEYSALSFRLNPSVGKAISDSERQKLMAERDQILIKIEQLRPSLSPEDMAQLNQFLKENP